MEITFPMLYVVVLSLPLYGVILCVLYAVITEQSAEASDCVGVPELLPSVSMVIGSQPQETFWKAVVAYSTPIRIGLALLYQRYSTMRLHALVFVIHMVELGGLFVLSFVSSTEDLDVHMSAFYAFAGASAIIMALNCLQASGTPFAIWSESTALAARRTCFFLYMVMLYFIYYLYERHTRYCEPYSYTYFAICEYLFVLTNGIYHSGILLDFWNWKWTLRSKPAINTQNGWHHESTDSNPLSDINGSEQTQTNGTTLNACLHKRLNNVVRVSNSNKLC